mmetsp:Transcript_22815/g.42992  ORF Transcript_22815/g.42992 Transcript_22815/m.42992 type:complete len:203 (-) Transcript_22815:95-703(-)
MAASSSPWVVFSSQTCQMTLPTPGVASPVPSPVRYPRTNRWSTLPHLPTLPPPPLMTRLRLPHLTRPRSKVPRRSESCPHLRNRRRRRSVPEPIRRRNWRYGRRLGVQHSCSRLHAVLSLLRRRLVPRRWICFCWVFVSLAPPFWWVSLLASSSKRRIVFWPASFSPFRQRISSSASSSQLASSPHHPNSLLSLPSMASSST